MTNNWFQEFLAAQAADMADHKGRGGISALARYLEMSRESVDRWASGISTPDVVTASKVIKKLGGDLARALPNWDWETDSPYDGPSMKVMGQIQAGDVELAGDSSYTISGVSQDLWLGKHMKTSRPVVLLEVQGDSMAPDYHEGDLIACRQPDSVKEIKDGTPCVFRVGNGYTFKILLRSKDKRIIGHPINPDHKPIIFDKGDEVRIEYVILGKIEKRGARKMSIQHGAQRKTA